MIVFKIKLCSDTPLPKLNPTYHPHDGEEELSDPVDSSSNDQSIVAEVPSPSKKESEDARQAGEIDSSNEVAVSTDITTSTVQSCSTVEENLSTKIPMDESVSGKQRAVVRVPSLPFAGGTYVFYESAESTPEEIERVRLKRSVSQASPEDRTTEESDGSSKKRKID